MHTRFCAQVLLHRGNRNEVSMNKERSVLPTQRIRFLVPMCLLKNLQSVWKVNTHLRIQKLVSLMKNEICCNECLYLLVVSVYLLGVFVAWQKFMVSCHFWTDSVSCEWQVNRFTYNVYHGKCLRLLHKWRNYFCSCLRKARVCYMTWVTRNTNEIFSRVKHSIHRVPKYENQGVDMYAKLSVPDVAYRYCLKTSQFFV